MRAFVQYLVDGSNNTVATEALMVGNGAASSWRVCSWPAATC